MVTTTFPAVMIKFPMISFTLDATSATNLGVVLGHVLTRPLLDQTAAQQPDGQAGHKHADLGLAEVFLNVTQKEDYQVFNRHTEELPEFDGPSFYCQRTETLGL
ncbi:hypothetical protein EYF80_001279 [Liparis tanakae]|uniref:Uncharacterized protein n=1 Tax=Liparis tanakae TaxID=230148 RepID=A0A4Z2JE24_9TELE|nr:hypothetical protein EYF80_001279 [Liparis tanakae]